MKRSIFLFLVIFLISCSSNDPEFTNLVSGKKWESHIIEEGSNHVSHFYPGYNIGNDSTGAYFLFLLIITDKGDTISESRYDPRFFSYTQQSQENYTFNFNGVVGFYDPYTLPAQLIQGQLLIDDIALDEVEKLFWE